MREPPPAFGRFGGKPPPAAVAPPGSKRLENMAARMPVLISSHGRLALALFVLLWIAAVAAFVVMKA